MTVVITVPDVADASEVVETRKGFVTGLSESYGAGRRYAATLVAYFRTCGFGEQWLTMPHDAKGPAGDAMRDERDTLYADLRSAGHTNPSVKWKQIKGYALQLVKAESGEDESGEDETETDSNGKRETRPVQVRMIDDLKALYKMCKREKLKLTPQQNEAHTYITSALNSLGVDVSML